MTREWAFLSAHGHVLLAIARNPDVRLRDIAGEVGVTERTVATVLGDLVEAGYVTRRREGRRNHYDVQPDLPLRHLQQAGIDVSRLLQLLGPSPDQ
jgi:DNA-binding IclR family transcriptional regulator